jgi:Fungal tRNA ligase phosphodiesterase domain
MIKLKSLLETSKRWSAVVLSEESRNSLISEYQSQIPQGWEIKADHQTINPFGIAMDEGETVKLKVIAIGLDDKALAVKVSGYNGKTNNAFPHITVAINRAGGAKPKDSNNIKNWTKVPNGITLSGTIENL